MTDQLQDIEQEMMFRKNRKKRAYAITVLLCIETPAIVFICMFTKIPQFGMIFVIPNIFIGDWVRNKYPTKIKP